MVHSISPRTSCNSSLHLSYLAFAFNCHARDNQSHPRPKFSPLRLVPPPRVHYRSPRSLARHYHATHTSYHTTSRPHNPTSQDLARTQPHASNLAISPAHPDSRRSTRLLEISLSPYYCLFAIFSSFPFMCIIVLFSALPLSRSRVYLSRYLLRLVV